MGIDDPKKLGESPVPAPENGHVLGKTGVDEVSGGVRGSLGIRDLDVEAARAYLGDLGVTFTQGRITFPVPVDWTSWDGDTCSRSVFFGGAQRFQITEGPQSDRYNIVVFTENGEQIEIRFNNSPDFKNLWENFRFPTKPEQDELLEKNGKLIEARLAAEGLKSTYLGYYPRWREIEDEVVNNGQYALENKRAVLAECYDGYLSADQAGITFNPKRLRPSLTRGGGSLTATSTDEGGFKLSLVEGKEFTSLAWEETSFEDLGLSEKDRAILAEEQYPVDAKRLALHWKTSDDEGFIFLSRNIRMPGLVLYCKETGVQILNMEEQKPIPCMLRKPVIYLYPEKEMNVEVSVKLKRGKMVTVYPKMNDDSWKVKAYPNGDLVSENGKKYSYLFWEADRGAQFSLDEEKSFVVAGANAEEFLEDTLAKLGLNSRESNDFIVYWLPFLERNKFNLVQFLWEEYTSEVELEVSPKPDSVLRIFMIFKATENNIERREVTLPSIKREGFVVVEWGGSNLDEGTKFM